MTLKSHSIQRAYVFTSNTLAVIRLSFTSRIVLKKRAIPAHIARFLTIEKASNTLKSINNSEYGPKKELIFYLFIVALLIYIQF